MTDEVRSKAMSAIETYQDTLLPGGRSGASIMSPSPTLIPNDIPFTDDVLIEADRISSEIEEEVNRRW
jgi:hypothetical protein